MLKKILIVVGAIILLPFLIGLFTSKSYSVKRNISISKPISEVYEYMKFIKNTDKHAKWYTLDPNMEKKLTGKDGTVGFISYWKSSNPEVGEGEQEIVSMKENERIEVELRMVLPFKTKDKAYIEFKPISEKETNVIWGFEGTVPYLWNYLILVFMNIEKSIGDEFEHVLSELKKELEN